MTGRTSIPNVAHSCNLPCPGDTAVLPVSVGQYTSNAKKLLVSRAVVWKGTYLWDQPSGERRTNITTILYAYIHRNM